MTVPRMITQDDVRSELRTSVYPEAVGAEGFGDEDDFFASGGDSMDLMRLLALTQERFDVDVDVREFVEEPTRERLARMVWRELSERASGR
ncbi:MAG TPA: acyl carrier protein [Glycomyces sp.]|nr:acyl carrier protein [Glycomyces sp.]